MLQLEKDKFKTQYDQLLRTKRTFIIQEKRSKKEIIFRGTSFCMTRRSADFGDLSKTIKGEVVSLFGNVKLAAEKYIVRNDFNIPEVKQLNNSIVSNKDKWFEMEDGEEFAYVDMSHCFWRIAFMQGIISEKTYLDILKKPHLKRFRNMSLSCIKAAKKRSYYVDGNFICDVQEDMTLYELIYDNIRFTAYNMCDEARKAIKKSQFIGYRTDAILCTKDAVKKVQKVFSKHGFESKITLCSKFDSKHFLFGEDEIKRF